MSAASPAHGRSERDGPARPEDENVEVIFPRQTENLVAWVARPHQGGDLPIGPPLRVTSSRCEPAVKLLLLISRDARRGSHMDERQFSIQGTRQIGGVLQRRA